MNKVHEILVMGLVEMLYIFGVANSSSSHTNNRKKNFLVLGEGVTQGINNKTGAAENHLELTLVKQIQNFA